jgi:hypothetical protein
MRPIFANKTFRWILIGAVSYIVFNVVTLLYCYRVVHDNTLGWTIDGITANRIFQISYQWNGDLSGYKIHFGQFAKDNSPCHTSLYFLENIHDGSKREALIIAHIPELMYYRPTGIDIEEGVAHPERAEGGRRVGCQTKLFSLTNALICRIVCPIL